MAAPLLRSIVSPSWLARRLIAQTNLESKRKLLIFDATWYFPSENNGKASIENWRECRIPSSCHWDIEFLSDAASGLPHTIPTQQVLNSVFKHFQITSDTDIVVYDQKSLFSAAHVWFILKNSGVESVAILDGGLPLWLELHRGDASACALESQWHSIWNGVSDGVKLTANDFPISTTPPSSSNVSPDLKNGQNTDNVSSTFNLDRSSIVSREQVRALSETICMKQPSPSTMYVLADARSRERFYGLAPEPRPGMRSGHIPGATSIPYSDFLYTPSASTPNIGASKRLVGPDTIRTLLGLSSSTEHAMVASCGTGLTGCVLIFARHLIDEINAGAAKAVDVTPLKVKSRLYNGSWADWGRETMLNECPVVLND